jgi:hypothetical protein
MVSGSGARVSFMDVEIFARDPPPHQGKLRRVVRGCDARGVVYRWVWCLGVLHGCGTWVSCSIAWECCMVGVLHWRDAWG